MTGSCPLQREAHSSRSILPRRAFLRPPASQMWPGCEPKAPAVARRGSGMDVRRTGACPGRGRGEEMRDGLEGVRDLLGRGGGPGPFGCLDLGGGPGLLCFLVLWGGPGLFGRLDLGGGPGLLCFLVLRGGPGLLCFLDLGGGPGLFGFRDLLDEPGLFLFLFAIPSRLPGDFRPG